MKKRYIAAITLLLFSMLIYFSEYYTRMLLSESRAARRLYVAERANNVRIKLESAINTTLNLTYGLIAYISVNPDFSSEVMDRLAGYVLSESDLIENIALARNNVISYVNPVEKNRKALGLDYMSNAEQRGAVLRMMETRKKVLAGPVNLVQGGVGIIGRVPVYTDRKMEHYWGLASVVIEAEKLYSRAGLYNNGMGLEFALRGKDGTGNSGISFFGRDEIFLDDPVVLPVNLPEGTWALAAVPYEGWHSESDRLKALFSRTAGIVLSLLLSGAVLVLLKANRTMQYYALYDQLTGLPNRRLFRIVSEQLLSISYRKNRMLAILFMDLDDFKVINDWHGHKSGDRALAEISGRIKDTLRKSDLVCRYGGDEFIIILHDVGSRGNAGKIAAKIIDIVRKPLSAVADENTAVGISIGISLYPEDGMAMPELVRKADSAMYEAKRDGKNSFRFHGV